MQTAAVSQAGMTPLRSWAASVPSAALIGRYVNFPRQQFKLSAPSRLIALGYLNCLFTVWATLCATTNNLFFSTLLVRPAPLLWIFCLLHILFSINPTSTPWWISSGINAVSPFGPTVARIARLRSGHWWAPDPWQQPSLSTANVRTQWDDSSLESADHQTIFR